MLFFSVLYVMLFLHIGEFTPINENAYKAQSTDIDQIGETMLARKLINNFGNPSRNEGNTYLPNIQSHKYAPKPQSDVFKQTNSIYNNPPLFQNTFKSVYNIPPIPTFRSSAQDNNLRNGNLQDSLLSKSNLRAAIDPNSFQNVRNINSNNRELGDFHDQVSKKIYPLSDEVKYELPGVSLDYLMSLNVAPHDSSPKIQIPLVSLVPNSNLNKGVPGDLKYVDRNSNIGVSHTYEAISQNPSAEVLYQSKQEIPYTISNTDFKDLAEDNNYFRQFMHNIKRQHDLHASTKHGKRYTVIGIDGTVEHFDDFETAAKKYPDFITVKASDLQKLAQDTQNVLPTSLIPSRSDKQTVAPHINDSNLTVTSHEKLESGQVISDTQESILETNSLRSNTTLKATGPSNKKQNITNFLEKNAEKLERTEIESDLAEKVNVSVTDVKEKVNTVRDKVINIDTLLSDKISISPHLNKTEGSKNDLTVSTNTTINDFVNNTLSTNLQSNTTLPTTILEPIINDTDHVNKNATLNSFEFVNETTATENGDLSTVLDSVDLNDSTESASTSLENEENVDSSMFWFEADNNFWEKMLNETENVVFFMFMPSHPVINTDTKTTVFPNGTTVEEITENSFDEDGVPTVWKTTKVTQSNNTDLDTII